MSMLRMTWNIAWRNDKEDLPWTSCDTDEQKWSSLDLKFFACCSVQISMTKSLKSIIEASSHHAVRLAVMSLSLHFIGENNLSLTSHEVAATSLVMARQMFYACDWKTAFQRCVRSLLFLSGYLKGLWLMIISSCFFFQICYRVSQVF